jgi:hypothetical protein
MKSLSAFLLAAILTVPLYAFCEDDTPEVSAAELPSMLKVIGGLPDCYLFGIDPYEFYPIKFNPKQVAALAKKNWIVQDASLTALNEGKDISELQTSQNTVRFGGSESSSETRGWKKKSTSFTSFVLGSEIFPGLRIELLAVKVEGAGEKALQNFVDALPVCVEKKPEQSVTAE